MRLSLMAAAWLGVTAVASGQGPDTVFLDELTWTEVRDRIANGATTVIVGSAGTEQNGPHMVLGKHKFIIGNAAERIARRLGNALVAPIITYVPEGGIDPPTGHMRFAGSITLPNEYFKKICEYAARSLKAHGFTDIVFIGDSGGNRMGLREVAQGLNEKWRAGGARVHFFSDYYSKPWLSVSGSFRMASRRSRLAGTGVSRIPRRFWPSPRNRSDASNERPEVGSSEAV